MNRYEIGRQLGEGSFGSVFLATKKSTGEQRAIKRMKGSFSFRAVVELRELQSQIRLPAHANIVQLYEIIRERDEIILFVFEYMPSGTLQDLIQQRRKHHPQGPLPDQEIRCIVQQLLRGLQHIHDHNTFHRDLKPENILLSGRTCKIADFSLARQIEENAPYTSYISTRWYRAPEILLNARTYSAPVDLFAMGCIATELYSLKPLFPGSDEVDQLRLIFGNLGTPRMHLWEDGINLLNLYPIQDWQEPQVSPRTTLQNVLRHKKSVHTNFDDSVLDFLLRLLALKPTDRMTAREALQDKYFDGIELSSRDIVALDTVTYAQHENHVATESVSKNSAAAAADVFSFSSHHTTPASNKHQQTSMKQSKHLVTVSPPPPAQVLLQQQHSATSRAMTTQSSNTSSNKRPANNSFLSPAASSISNPYTKKALHSNKRRA